MAPDITLRPPHVHMCNVFTHAHTKASGTVCADQKRKELSFRAAEMRLNLPQAAEPRALGPHLRL